MKRGFLNKTKASATHIPSQSTVTKPAGAISSSPLPISIPDNATTHHFTKTIQGLKFMNYDPHATVQYPEETCILTSVAPKSTHILPLGNEHAECIFSGGTAIKTVFSIPKFPLPMPMPNGITYVIQPTPNMGLGMFASQDIKKGDLILAERPLFLVPTAMPRPAIRDFDIFDMEKCLQPCFERLSLENQAAYRALANCHTEDGSGPLLGILRTNGFGVRLGEAPLNWYSAVYKELSRANHSCRPNAVNKFALSTFSAQLRALLDIKKGDEIFISYLDLPEITPKRQAILAPYGFQCTCASCTLPSFDHLCQKLHDRVLHLDSSVVKWLQDRSLPRDHLIKPALALVPLLEANGIVAMDIYEKNMVILMTCYMALGDLPNAMKYSRICAIWGLVRRGDLESYKKSKDPLTLLTHMGWCIRV